MKRKISIYSLISLLSVLVVLSFAFWMGCGDNDNTVGVESEQETMMAPAQDWIDKAVAIQERHTKSLLDIPGVLGTAVGWGDDGRPIIIVMIEGPDMPVIPEKLEGITVITEVTGKIQAFAKSAAGISAAPSDRFPRPVPIGVSTGHPNITAGTIGCRVKKGGNVYALSNNHVYADENRAAIGDSALQPGPYDGGVDPADKIGTLAQYKTIVFGGSNNDIDAAIALSDTTLLGNATPSGGYGIPKSATVSPSSALRRSVMKYGRTTGQTSAKVYGINATVNVQYDLGVAKFVKQIIIKPGSFSAGGDSGSLIVMQGGSNDRKPVGLLFAGSSTMTIANPIGTVLSYFGVTIDGQ